jgi:pheromone shutdown protein TraB
MLDGLLRLGKSSILAVVGMSHLEGIKHYWVKKIGIPQDSFLNLTSD